MGVRTLTQALIIVVLSISSCSSSNVVQINDLLGKDAPTYTLSGSVNYLAQYIHLTASIRLEASIPEDDDIIVASDQIGGTGGDYSIDFKWHSEVHYALRVVDSEGREIYFEELGQTENSDLTKNLTMY
jgi:hypothetical protein